MAERSPEMGDPAAANDRAKTVPSERSEFLMRMYDQMFNDIDTHILVVWQSVGVLVGAFAIFALTEKQVITLDIATALIVLLAAWLIGHLYDAAYWYNRNLVIIANIERQFLSESDLQEVHYYFGKHRKKGSMITHLRIQYALGLGITLVVLIFHFFTRIVPGLGGQWSSFDPVRALPYAVGMIAVLVLSWLKAHREKAYAEFLSNSPGREINVSGVTFGVGHPTDQP
jgi:hypothetical protein